MVTPTENIVGSLSEMDLTEEFHQLSSNWVLWAHLPHDNNWKINSYKKIYTFTTIEEAIAMTQTLPEILVKNCMLFLMKDGIMPIWEDPKNIDGGCFSYKISNKHVYEVWRDLSYVLVGETISTNRKVINNITGITISPKKNFCIVKVWLNNCEFQNPTVITHNIKNLIPQGCLFKKHPKEEDHN
jgi:hypothetical protein